MHDVVVIGGGPAGSRTAALLAKDYDVLVIEEHAVSGRPVQCAGIITQRTADLSGVRPEILNRLYGAKVTFPDGSDVTVRSEDEKAILIDRGDLDEKMAGAAMDKGAEYQYNTKYLAHKVCDDRVIIETSEGTVESKMIIGADGHSSKVAMSIPDNGPKEYVRGIEYDVESRMDEQDLVGIRIGSKVAPGLFTWEVPFGDFTRVGLCTSWSAGPPSEYLKTLMKISGLEGKRIVAKYSGKVPIGGRKASFGDHMLLIGDAAGQVKPVSAGGLYPAFSCAPILRDAVDEAFRSGDFSEKGLAVYEKRWGKEIGRELDRSYRLRKIYVKFTDDDMNDMSRYLGKEKANAILNGVDIDNPSGFALKAFAHLPTMVKLASVVIKAKVRK